MIDATQKKLREARFFLRQLEVENRRAVRNEPEVFDYFMSAFVSAARSVTFALQAEEKERYDAWFPMWYAGLSEGDRAIFDIMKTQRNEEQKQGGGNRRIEWEFSPVTWLSTDELGGNVFWSGPPGTPAPQVGRPIRYLSNRGEETELLAACKRYYHLLSLLVEDFMTAHRAA